jgi:hypothetical protein
MVFFIRVERPRSAAERRWNVVQDVLSPIVLLTPIVLKLTGVITWSWWWVVLAPAWISAALLALLVTGLVILFPGHAKPWSASEAEPKMPPGGTSG